MNLTQQELIILLYMIEAETAKLTKTLLKQGKKPADTPMIKTLNEISRKAYAELTKGA